HCDERRNKTMRHQSTGRTSALWQLIYDGNLPFIGDANESNDCNSQYNALPIDYEPDCATPALASTIEVRVRSRTDRTAIPRRNHPSHTRSVMGDVKSVRYKPSHVL